MEVRRYKQAPGENALSGHLITADPKAGLLSLGFLGVCPDRIEQLLRVKVGIGVVS